MTTVKELGEHPIASIFPRLNETDLEQLTESVREKGLLEPIWLYEGKILDGRHRYKACLRAGVPVETRTFSGSPLEAIQHVWAVNKLRRHLNPSQAAIADSKRQKMCDLYAPVKAAAKERVREGGKKGGKTAGSGRPKDKNSPRQLIDEGYLESPTTRRTDAIRATNAGTNRTYIHDADWLVDERPDLVAAIEQGEKTITQVKRELKEEAREQRRQENAQKAAATVDLRQVGAKFATIVIDPPWSLEDEGDVNQMGRAKQDYASMSIEELLKLPVAELADEDCHLYLWITNRSLPKGFSLLDAWGFRYVTMLTWPKPSFGLGNYFRGQTEQVLFGVKGSQGLKRKDASTLLPAWKRGPGGHSSKPVEFYDFVETCSPGPFIEVFSRQQREGWSRWGADA